jgi:hypothetical protein
VIAVNVHETLDLGDGAFQPSKMNYLFYAYKFHEVLEDDLCFKTNRSLTFSCHVLPSLALSCLIVFPYYFSFSGIYFPSLCLALASEGLACLLFSCLILASNVFSLLQLLLLAMPSYFVVNHLSRSPRLDREVLLRWTREFRAALPVCCLLSTVCCLPFAICYLR